jgi:hypothetical protein
MNPSAQPELGRPARLEAVEIALLRDLRQPRQREPTQAARLTLQTVKCRIAVGVP